MKVWRIFNSTYEHMYSDDHVIRGDNVPLHQRNDYMTLPLRIASKSLVEIELLC